MQKKTKAELKEIIVDLKMQVINLSIPDGNCPYAYYKVKNAPDVDCNNVSCTACKAQFNDLKRKEIEEYVDSL